MIYILKISIIKDNNIKGIGSQLLISVDIDATEGTSVEFPFDAPIINDKYISSWLSLV